MRVLHVVATGERRGAELFASDLVSALSNDGVEQRVAALRAVGLTAADYEAPTIALGPATWRLPGIRVDPGVALRLHRLVEEWPPEIVQAHGGEALKYAVAAAVDRRAKLIYRRVGGAPYWITRGVRKAAHRALMRRAARVVAVAEAIRIEAIETFGLHPRHVVTIPNAVDGRRLTPTLSREESRQALGIGPAAPVILSFGALTWEKDPLVHVEVARRVLRAVPDALHLVVGDGPMRSDVEKAIGRDLDGRTVMLGRRSDVADVLVASDVLLFASRPDGMEGMPGIIIEAGMTGLPVVGYAVAGVPELVIDGVTGRLVFPGDRDGLATRLLELLRDDVRRREMGNAARQRCRKEFDIASVAPLYLELYRSLQKAR